MVSPRLPSIRARCLGAAAGILADAVLGEPPPAVHPVVAFGRVMRAAERGRYRNTRVAGALHAATGATLGLAAGAPLPTSVATALAVGGRALSRAALDVATALGDDDLDQARSLLPTLVGRDPDGLDVKEVARAVVESVAENTVDAVVAPALWAALAGGQGAFGYRAVNTLDAMVGHRSPRYERFGWASARADDAANVVPARVTAILVMAMRPRQARAIVHTVRHHAPAHPSPNAGLAEAAFAAALGLRLGGTNRYRGRAELRPTLGDGRPPEREDIVRAVRLSHHVTWALVALLAGVAVWP